MTEYNDILDESNRVVGQATREEVIAKAMLHKAAGVMVLNSKRQIYVHQRALRKKVFPGYWGFGAGGAVKSNERYEDAARRELKEELGIVGTEIEFLFDFNYRSEINNYNSRVYRCVYDREIKLNKDEFEEGKFINFDDLQEFIKTHKFCPDQIEFFKEYLKLIK